MKNKISKDMLAGVILLVAGLAISFLVPSLSKEGSMFLPLLGTVLCFAGTQLIIRMILVGARSANNNKK